MRVFYCSGFYVKARTRKAARRAFEHKGFSAFHCRENVQAVKLRGWTTIPREDLGTAWLLSAIFGTIRIGPQCLN